MIAEINISTFDQYTLEYDNWFEQHASQYQSEILALKKAIPKNKIGIEIGVGTGRFAQPLNIKFGVESSQNMLQFSEQRGINVLKAVAEKLPIENETYDFALMVTTVCFLNNIPKAFSEVHRILKSKGEIIIGLIDKYSELGNKYEQEKSTNKFYKGAHFHSTEEITLLLKKAGFKNFQYWQTLTNTQSEKNIPCACCTPSYFPMLPIENKERPKSGFGEGSFVVIKAQKKNLKNK
ncbi:MAG: class I SAM-dependent methyltransferase [Bacteroidetes bacterium]|nr:class I SAM-dependent methyltransferase [Bacteroidota bacterium]